MSILNKLQMIFEKHSNEVNAPYFLFGLYEIINNFIYYSYWHWTSGNFNYPHFEMRCFATVLCFFLLLAKSWPEKLKGFRMIFWYFTVFYCLPYFETYTWLDYHHYTSLISDGMLTIFVLILIVDWLWFTILLVLGISLGCLTHYIINGHFITDFTGIGPVLFTYSWTILTGAFFSQNASRARANSLLQKQLSTIRTVCASIAHELRTPLLAIKSGAAGIKHFLPRLLETYKIAQENKLKIPDITSGHLKTMETVMNNIESEVDFSNDVITSLLTNAMHNNVSLNPKLRYDIASTVKAALLRYHFNPASQINVVHFDESNNFEYHADEILVTHIIFNLLKNSIYAIEEMRKGEIFITLAHEKNYNCLYFKDTAKGMSKETLSNLFQAFYTEKPNNTGIGLAFSKMVMDNLGGEIAVDSVLGEYTEFVLRFPIVKDSTKG